MPDPIDTSMIETRPPLFGSQRSSSRNSRYRTWLVRGARCGKVVLRETGKEFYTPRASG